MGLKVCISSLLDSSREVRGGRPCIAGTGISVHRIVGYYQMGLSPEEIADEYEHINLAQVYGALAYYHLNRQQIDTEMAAEQAEATRLELQHRKSK